MLEQALQNDTLLQQLNRPVETESSGTVQVPVKLIQPAAIRKLDSINQQDSTVTAGVQGAGSAQTTTNKATVRSGAKAAEDLQLAKPIRAQKVETFTEEPSKPWISLPEKSFMNEKPDWVIGVFILALILLATVRLFFNKYLSQLFHAVINYSTSSRLFRDRSVSVTHASFRLDLIFYLIFSVFIFQFFDEFNLSLASSSFNTYLIILGVVIGYYILKRLAYLFAGFVGETSSETTEFLYNMHLYSRILGLFLIPVSLVISFGALQNPRLAVFTGLFICAAFYFLLLFRGAKILITKHFSIFYLILYLCTLEILPLIFICNLVLVKNGIK
ncbi:DUF4271 domain-containing protein [uncultured Sunxiuqinia sp.]|uniref:DUF4271 domain-containing protein n=1 Tax=Sunxiuqinia rutila TaxID=1397841 RepID=UPI0026024646|nr:DUF4271 domain-containing protein [uncultured Sunxiuqinia sp.]